MSKSIEEEFEMTVKVTTDQTFEQDTSTGVSLTDFWATWCGPCRMQSPVIENLSAEMPNVHFTSIPTLLIKKDGKVVDKVVGYHSKEQLKQLLEQYENA